MPTRQPARRRRYIALDSLVDLINDIKAEKAKGATDAQLAAARDYQRKGGFMIDFVMSENSMGFHAKQEATRILGEAINSVPLGSVEPARRATAQSQPDERGGGLVQGERSREVGFHPGKAVGQVG